MRPTCNIGSRQVSYEFCVESQIGENCEDYWGGSSCTSKKGKIDITNCTLSNLPTDFVSLFTIAMVVATDRRVHGEIFSADAVINLNSLL